MDNSWRKISISFIPLLQKICCLLGFQQPLYKCINTVIDIAYVVVLTNSTPPAFVFDGKENGSLEQSCESAAKQMVLFLVRNFDIRVIDVNCEARAAAEKCASLFRLMRMKFEVIEKELPSSSINPPLIEDLPICVAQNVTIDFLVLLKAIVKKFSIPVTPLEVTSLSDGQFIAWFTFEVPNHVPPSICCIGERAASSVEAKESAARKAIGLMMPLYKFQVEDVNFHSLAFCHYSHKLERESYSTVKERVSGLTDDPLPCPHLVEQDQLTPCGEKNKVISLFDPPPAPVKRKAEKHKNFFSDVVPAFFVPPELETVFKRKKQE